LAELVARAGEAAVEAVHSGGLGRREVREGGLLVGAERVDQGCVDEGGLGVQDLGSHVRGMDRGRGKQDEGNGEGEHAAAQSLHRGPPD